MRLPWKQHKAKQPSSPQEKSYQWSNELTGLWVMYFPQSPVTWFIPQSDSVKEESCLLSCPLTSKYVHCSTHYHLHK